MGMAKVRFSSHLIRDWLNFPDTTTVVCSVSSEQRFVDIIVSDPALPNSDLIQVVEPTFTNKDGIVSLVKWNG